MKPTCIHPTVQHTLHTLLQVVLTLFTEKENTIKKYYKRHQFFMYENARTFVYTDPQPNLVLDSAVFL